MDKKQTKIILLATLLVILVGVVSATEVSDDTITTDTTTTTDEVVHQAQTTTTTTHGSEAVQPKEIQKEEKKTKTATKTYDVSNYKSLRSALTNSTYDTVTVNINSDITLAGSTSLNEAINTLIINGNGKTIDGQNNYQFLDVDYVDVTLKNLKIINCKADYGGAIYNLGTLTIYNSTFNNNNATRDGGAINNNGFGTLTIYNSTFNNNTSDFGGAIYNTETLTIYNSTFNNNTSAIGGAINNNGFGTLTIYNSTFNNNTSDFGGAICNYETLTIYNSTFNNNTATYSGGAIDNSGHLTITNCTIDGEIQINTTIAINDVSDAQYSDKLTITGGFTRSTGEAIKNATIVLMINGAKYNTKTDANGNYTLNYTANKVGTNNITASFNGNSVYNSVNTSKTFTVNKKDTSITLNYIPDTQYSEKVTISGSFTRSTGKAIANANIVLTVNGVKYTTKTDANGCYALNYTANKVGTNNVTAIFNGNSVYNKVNTSKTFTVNKKDTRITLNNIGNGEYSDVITISGKFTRSSGVALKNAPIVLTANGVKYTTKTDSNGNYALNYTATKVGTNNVTASFNGNSVYNSISTSKSFTVSKKDTLITLNYIPNMQYSDKVVVAGKFTRSTGEAIGNANIVVFINGVNYNTKTDANGNYALNYTATRVGTNNVAAWFGGNSVYNEVDTSRTFTVSKKDTSITLNYIADTPYSDKVTITGKFTRSTGEAVKNATIILMVNGVKYNTKTDANGNYALNYTATKVGTNNVTALFNGNTVYNGADTSKTFTVTKKDTKITINSIATTKISNKVTITGKLTRSTGEVLKNATVTVKVNNVNYNVKTDANGLYTLNYTTNKVGTNNVTASFNGNSVYNSGSATGTFKVTN